jgi:phage recombination protein Bet
MTTKRPAPDTRAGNHQHLQSTTPRVPAQRGRSRDQIDLIKATVAKGASDDELALFLYQCRRLGLDPLSRQIYFIRRWDSRVGGEVGVIQVSIDGLRLIAARTGRYRPDEEPPRYTYDADGKLVAARVRVWLYHAPTQAWYPVEAEAYYEEYAQRGRDGQVTGNWARMPRVMLAKCAEALALRKAFPAETSGIYELAEIGTVEPQDVPASAPRPELAAPEQPATPEQREAIHRLWHRATRGRFGSHEQSEAALDAWMRFQVGATSTQTLTYQQASGLIAQLQRTPAEELLAVAHDAAAEAAEKEAAHAPA